MQQLATDLPAEFDGLLTQFLADNLQQTFTFRKLDANTQLMPVQTETGIVPTPVNSARTIPGATRVRTSEGRLVQLMYAEGQEQTIVNGLPMLTDRPEPITFEPKEHCVVSVQRNNREKLVRMLFSNECRNSLNPAREQPTTGYVYELVQPARTAEQLVINKERVLDVQIAVRMASPTERVLACQRLEVAVSDDANVNATTLYAQAETDPEAVFRVLGDEFDKIVALVRDLGAAGVIEFDAAGRYFLTAHDRKNILDVAVGDAEATLVKYLAGTQGQRLKTALSRMLDEKASKKGKK